MLLVHVGTASYVKWSFKASTVKPVFSGHSKRKPKIAFQDQLSHNADQMYCRMLQGEHSAILLTFIKLPFVIKTFVLSIFKWLLKTGFTVYSLFFSIIVLWEFEISSSLDMIMKFYNLEPYCLC